MGVSGLTLLIEPVLPEIKTLVSLNGLMSWYYGGLFWNVDKTVSSLVHDNKIEPVILVSVWNLPTKRGTEYMPQKMFEGNNRETGLDGMKFKKEAWIESLT